MTCSAADHVRLRSPSQWAKLPLVGVQDFGDEKIELRNCPVCNSTLAMIVEESK